MAGPAAALKLGLPHPRPKWWRQMTQDRGQHLLLGLAIVGQEDMAEEGAAIAQQTGRPAGRFAGVVEPAAYDAGVEAGRLQHHDVPRVLPDRGGQPGDVRRLEADLGELPGALLPHVLGIAEAQRSCQPRRQQVAGQQLAARADETHQGRGLGVAQVRMIGQHGDRSPLQGAVEHGRLAEGLAGQAQFVEHLRNPRRRIVSGLPLALVLLALGFGRRQQGDFSGDLGMIAGQRPQAGRGRLRRRRGVGSQQQQNQGQDHGNLG